MNEVVHLLCAPFPTSQGTQASVAAFVRAANLSGYEHSLLVPAESHGDEPTDLPIERLPRLPIRLGARSGPSFARVASDLAALATVRRLVRGRKLLAHNVEAAFVAAAARIPFSYVAHTSMMDELPMYGRRGYATKRRLGGMLDRISVGAAQRTLAITPGLAQALERRFSSPVSYLPQPWRVGFASTAEGRRAARGALGLGDELVVLHAGNLDRYQGLERIVAALRIAARSRPTTLLVATESKLPSRGFASGLRVVTHRLADEVDRRRVHAAADVVVIAREPTHGLPIKLLDAFARSTPVLATRASLAGLALHDELAVAGDDPEAIAAALPEAVASGPARAAIARRYLERHHTDREAAAVLEAAVRDLRSLPRS